MLHKVRFTKYQFFSPNSRLGFRAGKRIKLLAFAADNFMLKRIQSRKSVHCKKVIFALEHFPPSTLQGEGAVGEALTEWKLGATTLEHYQQNDQGDVINVKWPVTLSHHLMILSDALKYTSISSLSFLSLYRFQNFSSFLPLFFF